MADFAEQTNPETWRADYEALKGFALIGDKVTLGRFADNKYLRDGLIKVDEIGKRIQEPPQLENVEELISGKANDFVDLVKKNGVAGKGLRAIDIFQADGLIIGLFDELKFQNPNINLSDYVIEEQLKNLKSGK